MKETSGPQQDHQNRNRHKGPQGRQGCAGSGVLLIRAELPRHHGHLAHHWQGAFHNKHTSGQPGHPEHLTHRHTNQRGHNQPGHQHCRQAAFKAQILQPQLIHNISTIQQSQRRNGIAHIARRFHQHLRGPVIQKQEQNPGKGPDHGRFLQKIQQNLPQAPFTSLLGAGAFDQAQGDGL